MNYPIRTYVVVFIVCITALALALHFFRTRSFDDYYCITDLEPLTVYVIQSHEWGATECYNLGPQGEESGIPLTEQERELMREGQ